MLKRKFFGFVGLMLVLPVLPYSHIFFKNDSAFWSYVNDIKFLKTKVLYFENLEHFIYHPLLWISISLIFYLLYKTSSLSLKLFFLFPVYFSCHKILMAMSPDFMKSYWYVYYFILFIPFAILYAKLQNKLTNVKTTETGNLIFNYSAIILLVSIPILHELWRLYPENTKMIHFIFFDVYANGFVDANHALYAILHKVCFLIPICIYFLTQRNWIKYAVLFPILIYSAQLINILNPELTTLDEIEVFQTLPYTLPLLFALFVLSKANDNQEKIGFWLANQYRIVEGSLITKFSDKEVFINDKRQELAKSKLEMVDLEKIKTELEQELGANAN
jgi:hypothetical protein